MVTGLVTMATLTACSCNRDTVLITMATMHEHSCNNRDVSQALNDFSWVSKKLSVPFLMF